MDSSLHASLDTRALHHHIEAIRIDRPIPLEDVIGGSLGRFQAGGGSLGTSSSGQNVALSGKSLVDGKLDTLLVAAGATKSAEARRVRAGDSSHVDDDGVGGSGGLCNRQRQQTDSSST